MGKIKTVKTNAKKTDVLSDAISKFIHGIDDKNGLEGAFVVLMQMMRRLTHYL